MNQPPIDVQLARLDFELRSAELHLGAGDVDGATKSLARCREQLDQIRKV